MNWSCEIPLRPKKTTRIIFLVCFYSISYLSASFSCYKRLAKIKSRAVSPQITESRGTPSKFVPCTEKKHCVKFVAFFHSVTISLSANTQWTCSMASSTMTLMY